jgi:hypothetical protein
LAIPPPIDFALVIDCKRRTFAGGTDIYDE